MREGGSKKIILACIRSIQESGAMNLLRGHTTPPCDATASFFIWTNFYPRSTPLQCGQKVSRLYLAAADKRFLPYSGMMASNVVPDFDSAVRRVHRPFKI